MAVFTGSFFIADGSCAIHQGSLLSKRLSRIPGVPVFAKLLYQIICTRRGILSSHGHFPLCVTSFPFTVMKENAVSFLCDQMMRNMKERISALIVTFSLAVIVQAQNGQVKGFVKTVMVCLRHR
jgi:hypothetical protein